MPDPYYRQALRGWVVSDDTGKERASKFRNAMLGQLPAEIAPIALPSADYSDANKAQSDYDTYFALPDTERASNTGKALAGRLKGYLASPKPYNPVVYEEPKVPAEGRELSFTESLYKPFFARLPEYTGAFFKSAPMWTPGESKFDQHLRDFGEWVASAPSDQLLADVNRTETNPLWLNAPDEAWYDPSGWQMSKLPSVVRGWATRASANAGIMLYSLIFGRVGGAAAMAAFGQAGPQIALPEEVVTVPLGAIVGGSIAMTAIESSSFIDEAQRRGVPLDIAEKYARAYGPLAGVVEQSQQMMYLKALGGAGAGKAVAGQMAKMNKYLVAKIAKGMLGMSTEGLEEATQGGLQDFFMAKAYEETKLSNPEWNPSEPAPVWSDKEKRQKEFALGFGLGAIYKMGGSVRSAIDGKISERARFERMQMSMMMMGRGKQKLWANVDSVIDMGIELGEEANKEKNKKNRRDNAALGPFNWNMFDQAGRLYEENGGLEADEASKRKAGEIVGRYLAGKNGVEVVQDDADLEALLAAEDKDMLAPTRLEDKAGRSVVIGSEEFHQLPGELGKRLSKRHGIYREITSIDEWAEGAQEIAERDLEDIEAFNMTFGGKNRSQTELNKMRDVLVGLKTQGVKLEFQSNTLGKFDAEALPAEYDADTMDKSTDSKGKVTYTTAITASFNPEAGTIIVTPSSSLSSITEAAVKEVASRVSEVSEGVNEWLKGTKESLESIAKDDATQDYSDLQPQDVTDEIIADIQTRITVANELANDYIGTADIADSIKKDIQETADQLKKLRFGLNRDGGVQEAVKAIDRVMAKIGKMPASRTARRLLGVTDRSGALSMDVFARIFNHQMFGYPVEDTASANSELAEIFSLPNKLMGQIKAAMGENVFDTLASPDVAESVKMPKEEAPKATEEAAEPTEAPIQDELGANPSPATPAGGSRASEDGATQAREARSCGASSGDRSG